LNRWNISGTLLHRVSLRLTGHNAVIVRNQPNCFSVNNFDMSLPTNSDSAARKFCKYWPTADKLNHWLQHPRMGTPRRFAFALLLEQLSPTKEERQSADKEYHFSVASIRFAWFFLSRKVCLIMEWCQG
jgi:hypothetical protein